jgi:hypothetical protein
MNPHLTLQRDGANSDTGAESHVPKAGTSAAPTTAAVAPTATGHDAGYLRVFVFALFFFFGGITSLNDVIIPRLKELFTLSYAEVMTVQSAFFGAYFIISLPAAAIVRRIGYMRSAVVGLLLMMIGCLLFIPASSSAAGGCRCASLVPRIVDWIDVGETQRPDRANLRDVFAGFGPMEMRLAAGQHYHAPGRVRSELGLVELVSQPDVKDAGDHRVNAVLRMPVRQHLGTGRQLDPNQIGSRLGRVADQDGEPCGWRKRWEGFPQDIFGMNDAESPLIGLMVKVPVNGVGGLWRVRHGGVPLAIRSD